MGRRKKPAPWPGYPNTLETRTTAEVGLGGRNNHEIPAGDLMNICTVAEGTDIDIKLPGFHQGQWLDNKATYYVIMLHEEPLNPLWTPKLEASPLSFWDHLDPAQRDERAVEGFKWGQDPDDPSEDPWAYVFTSRGLFEFIGYEIDVTPGLPASESFTGLFRKVEAV